MSAPEGWHAAPSDEGDGKGGFPFQPFLQVQGCSFPLPIWFQTEERCLRWIESAVLGQGLLED